MAGPMKLTDEELMLVVLRRLHDGIPFVLTRVHLPEVVARTVLGRDEVAEGAVGTNTIIGLTEPHLDEAIAEAAQSITVPPADADVVTALGCPPAHPMLRVDRLYSDASGTPVELAVSHFLPEQYTYRVTLRRSRRPPGRTRQRTASTRPHRRAVPASIDAPDSTR
jgi:DNA-binding GntR family transcriptional regulator